MSGILGTDGDMPSLPICPYASKTDCVCKPRRHSQELGKGRDFHWHLKKCRNRIYVCGRAPLIALLLSRSCIRVALML